MGASGAARVESLLKTLQGFGWGRLVALGGAALGVAIVIGVMMFRIGGEPESLLYSNLDLKEASQITAALDAGGIKYSLKGDGATIMVARDKVAPARLMLSAKGLPTSGSVGYEIFDNAPALGQTDFVQNLNMKRATEGELARTIRAIQGVESARVTLNLPKRQLFEQDPENPSASIMVVTGARRMGPDQVRAIRNLVAAGVPGLKPERVAIADQSGDLLAGLDDAAGMAGAGAGQRGEVEEKIRKQIKDLVEGIVGPGKARVNVTADLDLNRVTKQEEAFNPDGQVVVSSRTTASNAKENKPQGSQAATAAQNIPQGQQGASSGADAASTNGATDELTNYDVSKTTTTTIQEPGAIKRLSVSVAVDGITTPAAGGKGKASYQARTPEEMKRIEDLVRSAMGYDQERKDQVSVINVRFERAEDAAGGTTAASSFSFDKNDIMRGVELVVLLVVAALLILFVARPMFRGGAGAGSGSGTSVPRLAGGGGVPALAAAAGGIGGYDPDTGQPLLAAPDDFDQRIDIARIEGQVKVSSVRKVADFVEKHPEESVSILRSWLHEA